MSKKTKWMQGICVLALVLAMSVSACSKEESVVSTSSGPSKPIVEEEQEEAYDPGPVSTLTYLPVDEKLTTIRPIAVMIENTKPALPHYGINNAGIVYEAPMEGGLTRYMALFDDYENLSKIGNLRSARPYFVGIAAEYRPIYIHVGGNQWAKSLINSGYVEDLDGIKGSDAKAFFTTSDKAKPHNTYTSAENIKAGIEARGYAYDLGEHGPHFLYAINGNDLEEGEDVAVIKEYFFENKPYFIYDNDSKTYKRFQYGKADMDALANEQMSYTNIIFQNVDSSLYSGTQYWNIPIVGSGEGKFFTHGKMVDITWVKESEFAQTRYYYADSGEMIELNPGKTWVSLIQKEHVDKNEFFATEEEYKNN